MTALDPAARDLLVAIAAVLDVQPKPVTRDQLGHYLSQVADRAAVVRVACAVLLVPEDRQIDSARSVAAELQRLANQGVLR
jgi:hypothetical protein